EKETGRVRFKTNNAGGILGGISNGEEIRIRCAVKPTPTISVTQDTVNVTEMKDVKLQPITRRDPTLLSRIYPVIEAMCRCVILDAVFMAEAYWKVSKIDKKWLDI
ncbi:MAG: chorismate synthase, partial [Endomicrobiaceae bacterium]|nr:chorismate synthase [Endomicrobiaceae bacterium]